MKEIKNVRVEGTVVSTAKTERKKVILRDCNDNSFYVLLTNEQFNLLEFLDKKGLLDYGTKYEEVLDEDWEKI